MPAWSTASALRWSIERRIPQAGAASALAVLVLIGGPLVLGQRPTYHYLLFNLALAWIPFLAALVVEALDAGRRRRAGKRRLGRAAAMLGAAAVWLLFLPNAPYLVSDLTHFDAGSSTPWLDLARLVSFAWAGCLLGVLSLQAVNRVVVRSAGELAGWTVIVLAAGASGFGVVLGRFSRLNSWEAVTSPRVVLGEVVGLGDSSRSVAVGLFFGLLLLTIYAAVVPGRST